MPFARALLLALAAAATACPALAAGDEHQHNAAGVQAVEDHWLAAFLGGDEAFLGQLLDPDYVSVGSTGRARPKAEIIALAKKIAAAPRGPMDPMTPPHIDVRGDTAVVTSASGADISVDVFYWADGTWRAWYSQHTPVQAAVTSGR